MAALCWSYPSSKAPVPVQKEHVILFAILLTHITIEIPILAASHGQCYFFKIVSLFLLQKDDPH